MAIKSGLIAAIAALTGMFVAQKAMAAQDIPNPLLQEVLVKSILVTLNDAVVNDNFTVLHAKISKPFPDQFLPEKVRDIFKDFVDKHLVIDVVVAKPMIADGDAKIGDKGVLRLKGHFGPTPRQVKFQLGFIPSEGLWKLSAVDVDIA